jgi:hypothetical protein
MKKYMMGAAALLAIAAPAVAHADDAGSLGIHYANIDPDVSGADSLDTYGLDLAYVHSLDGGMAVQATASSDRLDPGGGSLGVGYAAIALGTNMENASYYGWLSHENFIDDAFGIGIGGRWDVMAQAVVNASVGYADFDTADSVTNVNLDGTWFFSDDLGVGAQVGYIDFDSGNATTYGVNGTYRFSGTPIAMNLGYQHIDGDTADANRWSIGFQWQFGTGSARENAEHGATWNGAERQYEDTLGGF